MEQAAGGGRGVEMGQRAGQRVVYVAVVVLQDAYLVLQQAYLVDAV